MLLKVIFTHVVSISAELYISMAFDIIIENVGFPLAECIMESTGRLLTFMGHYSGSQENVHAFCNVPRCDKFM